MRSFMREKKIYCGKHYREVDIYPYTAAQLTAVRPITFKNSERFMI